MRKITLMLLLLMQLLILCGCSSTKGWFMSKNDSSKKKLFMTQDEKAAARMEQIDIAFKNRDKDAIKSLFSKKALDEAEDFDGQMDYLFELLQANITACEWDGLISSDESTSRGKKTLMIRLSFDIKTDKDSYHFCMIDYYTDEQNPDNQGVYMLELIKFTAEKDLESWQNRMRAGIYIH